MTMKVFGDLALPAVLFAMFSLNCIAAEIEAQPPNLSFEFQSVNFKPGRPREDDKLEDALAHPAIDEIRKLENNAKALIKITDFRVEIIGATDTAECEDRDCYDLSTQRAGMIFDWLIRRGVPRGSLYAYKGFGKDLPISPNEDEYERRRNRRVELHIIRSSFGRSRSLIDEPRRCK